MAALPVRLLFKLLSPARGLSTKPVKYGLLMRCLPTLHERMNTFIFLRSCYHLLKPIYRLAHPLTTFLLLQGLSISASTLHAQGTFGARALAMGQASAALPDDNWAVFHNPALFKTETHAVSFYTMRYAGLSALTDLAASFTFDLSRGTLGAGLHRYGFDLFRETRFRAGYANRLDRLRYGLILNYSHVVQGGGYGSAGATGIDAGLAAEITDGLLLGARAVNLNRPAYGDTDEELPRELAIGLAWQMSGSALAVADLVKDVRFPLSARAGFELQIIPGIYGRTGITTEPVSWSLGFGFRLDRLVVNLAVQRHEVLGVSPAVDIGLDF